MNVRCPTCQVLFRVDPARIPASGVRARCSRCGNTFTIAAPAAATAPAVEPAAARVPGSPAPKPVAAAPQPAVPAPAPSPAAAPAAPARAEPVAGEAFRPPMFGAKDPNARAQRIARALVSDIVAYHKPKVEASLEAGTMRSDFREEIMKSWEEYVAQVGLELARGTPYFRNALNEILARGRQVF
jgi:predicted Zn finger-like uncharacterized protein